MAERHHPVPAPTPGSALESEALLIAASYKMTEDQSHPVIELYCKGRDGLSFIAFHEGFMPYFYALEPPKGLEVELKRDPRVNKVEGVSLYHEMKDRPALS